MHSFLEKLFTFHFSKTVYYFSEKPVNKTTYEQSSLKSGTSDQTTLNYIKNTKTYEKQKKSPVTDSLKGAGVQNVVDANHEHHQKCSNAENQAKGCSTDIRKDAPAHDTKS